MNHNFASFELTRLLPIKNEFGNLHKELNEYFWSYSTNQQRRTKDFTNAYVTRWNHYYYIRAAYTWEDIRLYLLSKGYEYNITTWSNYKEYIEICPRKFSCLLSKSTEENIRLDKEYFDTYEECRDYVITEALKLINK